MAFTDFKNRHFSPFDGSGSASRQNAKSAFFLSEPAVKGTVNYQDRLLLLVGYYVAKLLLKSEQSNADIKLKIVPDEGSKPIFIHTLLVDTDGLALRKISGSHNSVPISLVALRRKLKTSAMQKEIEELGGVPYASISQHQACLTEVEAKLSRFISDHKSDPGKVAQLSPVNGLILAELKNREALLLQACGGDKSKYKKLTKHLRNDIKKSALALRELYQKRRSDSEKIGEGLTVSQLVGVCEKWPALKPNGGASCNGPAPDTNIDAVIASIADAKGKQLYEWSSDYCKRIYPRVFGVEILEHSSLAHIDDLQNIIMLAYSRCGGNHHLEGKIQAFDLEFHKLIGQIMGADSELRDTKYWINKEPVRWFNALCSLSDRKINVLASLREMEKMASASGSGFEPAVQRLINLTLANMAVNLCRVSHEEITAWKEFSSKGLFGRQLKSSPEGKAFLERIEKFCSLADAERGKISMLESDVGRAINAYKQKKSALSKDLLGEIYEVGAFSPAVRQHLESTYDSTKTHVNYKQHESFPPNLEDACLCSLSTLSFFNPALSGFGAMGKMEAPEYSKTEARFLDGMRQLFDWAAEDGRIKDEIMASLEPLLHARSKGFDLERRANDLVAKGFTTQELEVHYKLKTKMVGSATIDMLVLSIGDRSIELDLLYPLPYDKEFKPEEFYKVSDVTAPGEELYGKKYSLFDLIDYKEGDSIGEIYRKLYGRATSNPEQTMKVRKKLAGMDMNSAHFLSTLADEEERSGILTDRLGRNLPTALNPDTKNSFAHNLRSEYPGYAEEKTEVENYLKVKLARRMIRNLNSALPHYLQKRADGIINS